MVSVAKLLLHGCVQPSSMHLQLHRPAPSNTTTPGGCWHTVDFCASGQHQALEMAFEARLLQAAVDADSPAALFATSTSYFTFLTAKQASAASCAAGSATHDAGRPEVQVLTAADVAQLGMELCWALTEPVWQEALDAGAVAAADMSLRAMEVAAVSVLGCSSTPDAACTAPNIHAAPAAVALPSPSSGLTRINSLCTTGHSLSPQQRGLLCPTDALSLVPACTLPSGPPWQAHATGGSLVVEHLPSPATVSTSTQGTSYATFAAAASRPPRPPGVAAASIIAALAERTAMRKAGVVSPVQQQQHPSSMVGLKRSHSCMDLGCHACEQRHGHQQHKHPQHPPPQQQQQQQCYQTQLWLRAKGPHLSSTVMC